MSIINETIHSKINVKVKVVEVDFMKKCKTLILIISFIMIISFFIIYNKKENYIDDNYYVQKNDSLLSMNLEQTAGVSGLRKVIFLIVSCQDVKMVQH